MSSPPKSIWQIILEFFASIFGRPTPPPVDPPPVDPPPPGSPERITENTAWRNLPPITVARLTEIFAATNSPMTAEAAAIHAAVKGNPLGPAQSWKESNYGASDNAKRTKNPLGLLQPPAQYASPYATGTLTVNVNGHDITLLKFASYADAFKEYQRRMTDPAYKAGVYSKTNTVRELIYTFVGGPDCLAKGVCGNGETQESCERYNDDTVARINRYYGYEEVVIPEPEWNGYKAHAIAGTSKKLLLPADIPFRIQLTTISPNRTYTKRTGQFVTVQHTTNNPNPYADAGDHAQWQFNGTPGHPNGDVSVHFYVDDGEIVQTLPFDEKGIHSGDWRNDSGVAVEDCTNAGINVQKRNQFSIALQAALLNIGGRTALDAMYPHTDGGHCPVLGMSWKDYETAVDVALAKLPAA